MKFIEVPGDDEILEKAKYLEMAYYLTRLAKGMRQKDHTYFAVSGTFDLRNTLMTSKIRSERNI